MPRFVRLWTFCLCLSLLTFAVIAQEQKPASKEPDYAAELPKIAPKSPEGSLKTIRLKAGFHAELVAHEPLIRSPMGMDFDEFGRAFVVELPEYNQYGSAKPHGKGSIKLLTDSDNDGRFDKATVYVDNLDYPTAVACWDGGILVGVAPDILYCKDTNGDGKADVRTRLFTGFGQDKSGEGMLNSFRWRFDNTIHIDTGLDGGEIVPVVEPNQSKDAPAVRAINARGQHLLLEPRTRQLTATSGGGQHGMGLDDWNLHAFVCGNSEPVHMITYDGRYLARNAYQQAPTAAINIAPQGKFTKLMRISAVEPWRILRTRLRSQGTIPGSDEGGTPSGFFTGATGITVYRGDAWPDEFRGQLFVGEVANNLVYRARLVAQGVLLSAERADMDAEFLASSDNWFRPVQFANAPDGTLYVIDMYRELIEGAAFLAPQILKHMDPSAGADKGRIYRIAPNGFKPQPIPRLGDLTTAELVKLFEHRNGWHRDTASRLVYQRQDRAAIEPLQQLAAQSKSPLARVMALYSLRGLGALTPNLVQSALKATESEARQHALKLSEAYGDQPEMLAAVTPLADDSDERIRYQAAFTLGPFPQPAATAALVKLVTRQDSDSWIYLAVLSSIAQRRAAFVAGLLQDPKAPQRAPIRTLLTDVAAQIGAANDRQNITQFLQLLDNLPDTEPDEALVVLLMKSLVSKLTSGELLNQATGKKTAKILASLIENTKKVAGDTTHPPDERASSVRLLASVPFADNQALFAQLLESQQPLPVQQAVLQTLARFDHPEVPKLILDVWSAQTPNLRATSIETLFTRPTWINAFLDAVEQKAISPTDLDPARVALLQKDAHPDIRERAKKLFASSMLARRQEVVDMYQKALETKGDVDRGRTHFRKVCATCHKLEGFGESIGADLNAIRDRGTAAVLLNILDPNREVKPQFTSYVVVLDSGRTVTGLILSETATSLTIRKNDNTTETVLRVNIDELKNTGISFMPEGLEKQLDVPAIADVLAYLNSIK